MGLFTIENWINLLSVVLVGIGGTIAIVQLYIANRIKKAEFFNQIIEKLRFDKEMAATMYMVDYSHNWYDNNFQNGEKDTEYKVDKLFSYLSYICYLRETRNISNKEFSVLKYELSRACLTHASQSYLWNIYHFSHRFNSDCSFEYLIKYGIREGLINKQFIINNTNLFSKKLNF